MYYQNPVVISFSNLKPTISLLPHQMGLKTLYFLIDQKYEIFDNSIFVISSASLGPTYVNKWSNSWHICWQLVIILLFTAIYDGGQKIVDNILDQWLIKCVDVPLSNVYSIIYYIITILFHHKRSLVPMEMMVGYILCSMIDLKVSMPLF